MAYVDAVQVYNVKCAGYLGEIVTLKLEPGVINVIEVKVIGSYKPGYDLFKSDNLSEMFML